MGDQITSVDGYELTPELAKDASFQPNAGAIYAICRYMPLAFCNPLRAVYTPNAWLEVYRQSEDKSFFVQIDGVVTNNLMRPTGKSIDALGYLELTVRKIHPNEYLETVAEIIEQVNQTPTCGWIIDLRRHAGGEGPFVRSIQELRDQLSENLSIAVLISPLTYSRGETTVQSLQLRRLKWSQLFGETTGGGHPSVNPYQLSEGVSLGITTSSASIQPDFEVKNDWTRFQAEDDPVILAAKDWLEQQPACAN